jgi:PTS system fructose-specific IIC component
MPELITTDLVVLDADLGADKSAVIRRLAELVAAAGRATADGLYADVIAREGQAATGLPGGIAIPHCRSAAVTQPSPGWTRRSTSAPPTARPNWSSSSPPRRRATPTT